MNDESTFARLKRDHEVNSNDFQSQVSPAMEIKKENILNRLSEETSHSKLTYSVIDLNLLRFIYHESKHEGWRNYPAINIDDDDNFYQLKTIIHEDDMTFTYWLENKAFKFLKKIPARRLNEFCLVCFRRIKKNNGEYEICFIKITSLLCNEKGEPWLLLCVTLHEKIVDRAQNIPIQLFRLYPMDLNNRKIHSNENDQLELTEREFEVLSLYGCGLTLKEVANNLGKSITTVNSHFDHIREKTNKASLRILGLFAKIMKENY